MSQDRFERTFADLHRSLVRAVERFEEARAIKPDPDAYIRQHSYEPEDVIRELVLFRMGIFPDEKPFESQTHSELV